MDRYSSVSVPRVYGFDEDIRTNGEKLMKLFEIQKCPICDKMRCEHQHEDGRGLCPICRHHPCACADEQEEVEYKGKKIMVGKHDDVSDSRFDPDELSMGIEDEMEHTNDKRTAKNIAKDHLVQIPDYYSRQKKFMHEKPAEVKSLKTWLGAKGNDDK